jgi:hypothetical protein
MQFVSSLLYEFLEVFCIAFMPQGFQGDFVSLFYHKVTSKNTFSLLDFWQSIVGTIRLFCWKSKA